MTKASKPNLINTPTHLTAPIKIAFIAMMPERDYHFVTGMAAHAENTDDTTISQ